MRQAGPRATQTALEHVPADVCTQDIWPAFNEPAEEPETVMSAIVNLHLQPRRIERLIFVSTQGIGAFFERCICPERP